MLLFMAVSQFILPVIGNGEADLAKHMFLFNVLIDSIIFLMVSEGIKVLCSLKLRKDHIKNYAILLIGAVLLASALFFITRQQAPKTIIFGQYENKKLVWDIAQETDKYYLLIAHDIIAQKPFDNQPNNLWNESEIRIWLNSNDKNGFLEQFSQDELNRMIKVEMKSVVSPVFDKKWTVGTQQLYWSALPGDTMQNYADAYGIIEKEQVFLLSVKDWEQYTFDKKKDKAYWLRTPYSNIDAVRMVDVDGYVYHKKAMEKDIGVLPAVYITK
jgi:hypothetical protein